MVAKILIVAGIFYITFNVGYCIGFKAAIRRTVELMAEKWEADQRWKKRE